MEHSKQTVYVVHILLVIYLLCPLTDTQLLCPSLTGLNYGLTKVRVQSFICAVHNQMATDFLNSPEDKTLCNRQNNTDLYLVRRLTTVEVQVRKTRDQSRP